MDDVVGNAPLSRWVPDESVSCPMTEQGSSHRFETRLSHIFVGFALVDPGTFKPQLVFNAYLAALTSMSTSSEDPDRDVVPL
jgi:hypothetical protein